MSSFLITSHNPMDWYLKRILEKDLISSLREKSNLNLLLKINLTLREKRFLKSKSRYLSCLFFTKNITTSKWMNGNLSNTFKKISKRWLIVLNKLHTSLLNRWLSNFTIFWENFVISFSSLGRNLIWKISNKVLNLLQGLGNSEIRLQLLTKMIKTICISFLDINLSVFLRVWHKHKSKQELRSKNML